MNENVGYITFPENTLQTDCPFLNLFVKTPPFPALHPTKNAIFWPISGLGVKNSGTKGCVNSQLWVFCQ